VAALKEDGDAHGGAQLVVSHNLGKIKNEISGDELREVALIAQRLGVPEEDVVEMNRRLLLGDVLRSIPTMSTSPSAT
jgi:hypothetical protein